MFGLLMVVRRGPLAVGLGHARIRPLGTTSRRPARLPLIGVGSLKPLVDLS